MPDSLEEALHRHCQFVHIHSDLIVRPEEQVPADGQQLYAMLAEEDGDTVRYDSATPAAWKLRR